jgi:RNA polymerase sigma-70 factor, ECF subfamily
MAGPGSPVRLEPAGTIRRDPAPYDSSATERPRRHRWTTVDQRELVERAGRGDHDAFAMLVRGAIARLDAAARLILHDPELARDAVQEALFGAWRDLPGLRDPDRFDAWIHRLTVHSCLDILRRRRRRVIEVELTPIDDLPVADLGSLVADRDLLDRALRRLDPEWRAVVVVHYFLGMPLPQTAQALGIPLGTVKSRLHRSLAAMRIAMEAEPSPGAAELPRGQFA